MFKITFDNRQYEFKSDESVLDCLLRYGVKTNYSCKNGVCQSCIMCSVDHKVPDIAQGDLKSTLREQGYFLSCLWHPQDDIVISKAKTTQLNYPAIIIDKHLLSSNVCRIRLKCFTAINYHAGQFINLCRRDGLSRSYSLASLPEEKFLELHVKRLDNGVMSNWILDELNIGDRVDLQGPLGDCFYIQDNLTQPMLLIGTGSGAAPLWGIVREALKFGHTGPVYFYHGARQLDGLYLDTDLKTLSENYPNFSYIPCISKQDCPEGYQKGRADILALKRFFDLQNWCIYLCGLPNMVHTTRKLAYLAGAAMNQIHADPFEMKELRGKQR